MSDERALATAQPARRRPTDRVRRPPGGREVLVAVTDHAAERYRQRVRGTLDARAEIAARVAAACAAGRVRPGERGALLVEDLRRRALVYVCRPERGELVVTTLWEEGEAAAVPRRFTDALRRDDHRVR